MGSAVRAPNARRRAPRRRPARRRIRMRTDGRVRSSGTRVRWLFRLPDAVEERRAPRAPRQGRTSLRSRSVRGPFVRRNRETLQHCQQSFYWTESKFTMDFRLEAGCNPVRRNPGAAGARRAPVLAAWLVGTLVTLSPAWAWAETKVEFWHAMTGELRPELDRLVAAFNPSQPDARIFPTPKAPYPTP